MKIHQKYDLGELARKLIEARTNAPGEPASFKGFEIRNVRSVLETCVDFNPAVPESDRNSLIWRAITTAAELPQLDVAGLQQCLRNAERNYLRRERKPFIIASSLTFGYFDELSRSVVDGVSITYSRSLPPRFSRAAVQEDIDRATAIEQPHRLCVVRTRVEARTEAAAMHEALDTVDYLRGIWNYVINSRTLMRRSIGATRPVNEILWDPVHSIHKTNGALATDAIWAESKHQQFGQLYRIAPQWENLHKREQQIRRRLSNIDYGADLKALLIRYTRALDTADYDSAFSRLWGVFEHLAGAIGNYDALIKRTLFLITHEVRDFERLILEHLRDVRNGLVHADRSRREMETHLYQLRWFVEGLLRFHLAHGREFRSLSVAGHFLDLPQDTALLKQRVTDLGRAIRFQSARVADG
ncbi:MAG TPA: hypothetical protein VEY93_11100 [Longimicrobium sp.]|nr:hypothetical protein [Longimicrobium sp.]